MSERNPITFDLLGVAVPILPVLIGVLSALLVRVIVVTSSRKRLASYNVAVTLLSMLGAATFITDNDFGPGGAFWAGLSFGAAGVTIIEIARSQFMNALRSAGRSFLASLIGDGKDEKQ